LEPLFIENELKAPMILRLEVWQISAKLPGKVHEEKENNDAL
jgi:hypothetical protein